MRYTIRQNPSEINDWLYSVIDSDTGYAQCSFTHLDDALRWRDKLNKEQDEQDATDRVREYLVKEYPNMKFAIDITFIDWKPNENIHSL